MLVFTIIDILFVLAIHIVSTISACFLFSFVTALLIVFGIEENGGDPGAPIIMLISLLVICGLLSFLTASAMAVAKLIYRKEFPVTLSSVIFPFMYLPFHILGFYFPDRELDFLASSSIVLLFFSFVPFYHAISQIFINIYEFLKKVTGFLMIILAGGALFRWMLSHQVAAISSDTREVIQRAENIGANS
jgi:hypothetical protein